jgi:hypothetical protein
MHAATRPHNSNTAQNPFIQLRRLFLHHPCRSPLLPTPLALPKLNLQYKTNSSKPLTHHCLHFSSCADLHCCILIVHSGFHCSCRSPLLTTPVAAR